MEKAPLPLIGLTGLYCAGKNYVASILEERGLEVLDVDKLGHAATELEKEPIVRHFGDTVLNSDGTVNRKTLGELVFGKPDELAFLEGIIHPAANRLTEEWIENGSGKIKVINAALLHRSTSFGRLDFIIIVRAPLITRFLRARKRDKLPFRQLIKRFKSQKEFISQYLSQNADIRIVDNKGYFGICSRLYRRRLENRIDEILAKAGCVLQEPSKEK
ncbi:dephospho-CoA kinase [Breznakiella homolactica]|uniref:Dephospho-CoA kinase n=1 Tax=Breznakiella homolactica TaxID=2798577 RepID=A0A7T7XNR7_9SPIR|nr:dephospho-CoA kinase [Breznakiella homolactica]QQO09729.1 dephospho-CoA kinase [Breznakiella homolactica]